jgi:hypothetical protein
LRHFCWTEPRLPEAAAKSFNRDQTPLGLAAEMGRADIIARLESIRGGNKLADLAFYAYRDLGRTDPEPFLRAALARSPVSLAATAEMDDAAVMAALEAMPDESIYDEPHRLAQPDEVWNFGRGDGLEKALVAANVLGAPHPELPLTVEIHGEMVTTRLGDDSFRFATTKGLPDQVWDCRRATEA